MSQLHRSGCPINLTLEVLGDKWSLLILRDVIFADKRHFREWLQSPEGIASNILSDRLAMLVDEGLLTRASDPSHRQKVIYSLTEKSIALVPVLVQIGIWGRTFLPANEEASQMSRTLEDGGPALWEEIMTGLRERHLGHLPTA